jgi:arylformamidase
MKLAYDISPSISEQLAVFPGDEPFTRIVHRDFASHSYQLSALRATLHLGAHVDAPCHYTKDGHSIEAVPLDYYFGLCQVIHLPVQRDTLQLTVADFVGTAITQPRVLIATHSFLDPNQWTDQFMALAPEVVHYLAEKKVCLIGIDTPSIDPATAKQLRAHEACATHNIAILEGIVLAHVPAGDYQLMALPLKIKDADASPVRAVLFEP